MAGHPQTDMYSLTRWSFFDSLGGEDVHRVVHRRLNVGRVAGGQLRGKGEIDDAKAVATEEGLVVLRVHAERHGLADQAQGTRRGAAGRSERAGVIDEVPHVVGDLRAVAAQLMDGIEVGLD